MLKRIFINITRLRYFSILMILLLTVIFGTAFVSLNIISKCENETERLNRKTIVSVYVGNKFILSLGENDDPLMYSLMYSKMQKVIDSDYIKTYNYGCYPLFRGNSDMLFDMRFDILGIRDFMQLERVRNGKITITEGRSFSENELLIGAYVLIVNDNFARRYGYKINDILMIDSDRHISFKIVGIYNDIEVEYDENEFRNTDMLYTTLGAVKNDYYNMYGSNTTENLFSDESIMFEMKEVSFILKNPGDAKNFIQFMKNEGINNEIFYMRADDLDYKLSVFNYKSMHSMMNNLIIITFLAGSGIVISVMILFIIQRKKEFGIMRMLGIQIHKIITQVVGEVFVLTIIGLILGFVLSMSVLNVVYVNISQQAQQNKQNVVGTEIIIEENPQIIDIDISMFNVFLMLLYGVVLCVLPTFFTILIINRHSPLKILIK